MGKMGTGVQNKVGNLGGKVTVPYQRVVDGSKNMEPKDFVVSWWNGGGKMYARMAVNQELTCFLNTKPDIFAYGESQIYKNSRTSIPGYRTINHLAKRNTWRRGIAVHYLQEYQHVITKGKTSKVFDILWIRIKTPRKECVICFFYAPGEAHAEAKRIEFYNELRSGYQFYSTNSKIILLGDTNARLGRYSGDLDIHGKLVSNRNKPLFLSFLEYTGLTYLNGIYARGLPTYEIKGRRRSIIDAGLSNSVSFIKSFEVMSTILGANAQTCHKVLKLTMDWRIRAESNSSSKTEKIRYCTDEVLRKVNTQVAEQMRQLRVVRGTRKPSIFQYGVLRRLYYNAKLKFVGLHRKREPRIVLSWPIRTLQEKIGQMKMMMGIQATDLQLWRLQSLEKQLHKSWELERHKKFANWLKKLNVLGHQRATRSFFAELKSRNGYAEVFGPIRNKKGQISTSLKQSLKNWREFYQDLYKGEEQGNLQMGQVLRRDSPRLSKAMSDKLDEEITIAEVVDAISLLTNYSAPGTDSILSRDFTVLLEEVELDEIWRSEEILRFIHGLLSELWVKEVVPKDLKESVIRPFLKDSEKDPTDPANYRPVALLNVIMKVYEQVIKSRLVAALEKINFFADVQAAFRKGRSTADHLLVLQEIFFHYRYTKKRPRGRQGMKPLFLGFMDIQKAFDTVPRKVLFKKLKESGLCGKMLRVIMDLYTNNRAVVRIGAYTSESFYIKSGVLQGSKLGPVLFNIFINDLLIRLQDSKLGVTVGGIKLSDLGFADDILLLTEEAEKLQVMIDICGKWAKENGINFNIGKCKVMVLNNGRKDMHFYLQGEPIEIVAEVKYLGILLSSTYQTTLYGRHITKVIEKAEKRASTLRHMGYHSDGLRPETAVRMYKILIRPLLEYGAQALSYENYYLAKEGGRRNSNENGGFINRIEKLQNRVLKRVIPCPKSTPPEIIRLLTGIVPMSGRIAMLKLRYLWKLHHGDQRNNAHRIYRYKRKHFFQSNIGFVHEAFNLCCRYNCMDVWHGSITERVNPYMKIRSIVETYHYEQDLKVAQKTKCIYTALHLFDREKYGFDSWFQTSGRFESSIKRRCFIYALLDTGAYRRDCRRCGENVADIVTHCFSTCPGLDRERQTFILRMKFYGAPEGLDFNSKEAVFRIAYNKQIFLKELCNFLLYTRNE